MRFSLFLKSFIFFFLLFVNLSKWLDYDQKGNGIYGILITDL